MQDRSLSAAIARNAEFEGVPAADKPYVLVRNDDRVTVCMARWPGGIGEEPLFTDGR